MALGTIAYPKLKSILIEEGDWNQIIEIIQRGETDIYPETVQLVDQVSHPSTSDIQTNSSVIYCAKYDTKEVLYQQTKDGRIILLTPVYKKVSSNTTVKLGENIITETASSKLTITLTSAGPYCFTIICNNPGGCRVDSGTGKTIIVDPTFNNQVMTLFQYEIVKLLQISSTEWLMIRTEAPFTTDTI